MCEGDPRSYEVSYAGVEPDALAAALGDDRVLSPAECRAFCEGAVDEAREREGSLERCDVHGAQDGARETEVACTLSYPACFG